eukprot:CAMPEP_0168496692 /NCGR_PEP_ID=MMETSP0228-20121227/72391_1 /TAXON_ID=133427 /ORGANISM="Protoceratium reticulatum, Strain CCCM 535 (=CCMP 1889)" /LENGTH=39 /DNA_ID= /DNA_START= /DNA_END= /DNA_ORIENTATION=
MPRSQMMSVGSSLLQATRASSSSMASCILSLAPSHVCIL